MHVVCLLIVTENAKSSRDIGTISTLSSAISL